MISNGPLSFPACSNWVGWSAGLSMARFIRSVKAGTEGSFCQTWIVSSLALEAIAGPTRMNFPVFLSPVTR